MPSPIRLLLSRHALSGLLLGALLMLPSRPPTVTETLLGPSRPAGQYVVSPDGGHVATFSTHGSREVIVIDGVDGPEYDDAGRPNPGLGTIDVAFSPDGKRSAYIARKGDMWVAVVDGKEAFPVIAFKERVNVVPGIDQFFIRRTGEARKVAQQFLFSPSGAHVAVLSQEPNAWHMFLDGVKSPTYSTIDPKQVAFVGERLLYVATTPDGKQHVVIDNTPGPGYTGVQSLTLSANAQHYAFQAQNGTVMTIESGGATGPAAAPIVVKGGTAELVVSPTGKVAYIAASAAGTQGEPALFLGSQEIAMHPEKFFGVWPATGEQKSDWILFSRDGSKFAYAKRVPGGTAAVIDGKQGIAYESIGLMDFSPDGKRAYAVGMKRGVSFVVIDGQEMNGENLVQNFRFSPDGTRFGYEAGTSVMVDGKEVGKYRELIPKSFTWSPDSKHFAFAACAAYTQCQLIQDGTGTSVPRPMDFISRTGQPHIVFPAIFFSPDGSRVVYNADVHSVRVGSQEVAKGGTYEFPAFSPDGKHFAVMGWTGRGMTPIVDGVAGPAYDDILADNRNVVRFLDTTTLRFLAVKGGSVYRVVMDLK